MATLSSASHGRLRLLSLVQQRAIQPDDQRICPPLTDEEREWLGLAPKRLLAETMAGDVDAVAGGV